jgi:hypothetical protein
MFTVDGVHVTATDEIAEGGADCTVTDAVPTFVASCVLVAVTVTVAPAAGAVSSPLAFIVPALAAHVTAELKLPVPCTVALHCELAPVATMAGAQATATEETLEATGSG